jgi:hypothetical protein
LVVVCALVLAGCGGQSSNFANPTAKLGTPPATPAAPPDTGSTTPPSSGAATPSAQPAAPPPQSSSLPTPPSNAVVFDQVQNTTDNWDSCSVCAQGTSDTNNFWMSPHTSSPSMTGSSRELYVGGPPWSNALFWKTYYDNMDKTHILWDFYVYWDDKSMANIWTAEFDFWQSISGQEFMIGSQCNFGDGFWDIWDSKANKWLHSDVRCDRMEPKKWHRIQWYMERQGSDSYRYVTLVLDGKSYDINQTFSPNPTPWKDTMGIQWQLDQSSTGVDIHQWIDSVKLTVW